MKKQNGFFLFFIAVLFMVSGFRLIGQDKVISPFEGNWIMSDGIFQLNFEGNNFVAIRDGVPFAKGTFIFTDDLVILNGTHTYESCWIENSDQQTSNYKFESGKLIFTDNDQNQVFYKLLSQDNAINQIKGNWQCNFRGGIYQLNFHENNFVSLLNGEFTYKGTFILADGLLILNGTYFWFASEWVEFKNIMANNYELENNKLILFNDDSTTLIFEREVSTN